MAGVEAEADVHLRIGAAYGLPETGECIEPASDGVVPAGRVLDVQQHPALEHVQRPHPSPDARVDPVLCMAGVDDHRGGLDLPGGVAGLLEDLAGAVADVVPRRADVDQIGRVDVDGYRRAPQLRGVGSRWRLPPALRVGEEDLEAVRTQGGCLLQRALRRDVSPDGERGSGHSAEDIQARAAI